MKLVKLWVLVLGLGWGLVCWGQPSGSVDPGEEYFQRGQFELAVQEWEANRSSLSVGQLLDLATAYQQLGRLREAFEILAPLESDKNLKPVVRAQLLMQLSEIYLGMIDLRNQKLPWIDEVRKKFGERLFTRQEIIKKAEYYLAEAEKLVSTGTQSTFGELLHANLLNQKANLRMGKREYSEALVAYGDSLAILKDNDNLLKAKIWTNLVQVYAEMLSRLQKEVAITKLGVEKTYKCDSLDSPNLLCDICRSSLGIDGPFCKKESRTTKTTFGQQELEFREKVANIIGKLLSKQQILSDVKDAQHDFALVLGEVSNQIRTLQLPDSHDKSFLLINLAQQLMQVLRPLPTSEPSEQWWSPLSPEHRKLAYDLLNEALGVADRQRDKRAMAYVNLYLADLYAQEKRYQEATRLINQAIFQIRNYPFPQLHVEFQIQRELWGYPDLLFRLEWQLGRSLKAQSLEHEGAYERAAGYLQQVIKTYASAGVSQSFSQQAIQFNLEWVEQLLEQATADKNKEPDLLRKVIDSFESFKTSQLQGYFQDYCATEMFPLAERSLPAGTAVFYPLLLNSGKIELLLRSQEKIQRFSSDAGVAALKEQAYRFLWSLSNNPEQCLGHRDDEKCNYRPFASRLYQFLIKPISEELNRLKIKTLIIVPHDILLTIPFVALLDEKNKYLLEKDYTTSITYLSLRQLELPEKTENVALTGGLTKTYSGLPCVQYELEQIRDLIKQTGSVTGLSSTELQDENFTLDKIREVFDKHPRIVHFSTHGFFDSDNPDEIYLLLKDKQPLKLEELANSIQTPLELMSFSACQTANTPQGSGAELGLAGMAVRAGVHAAVATLWNVNDPSTALLMTEFYKRWLKTPTPSVAKILQESQQHLLHKTPSPVTKDEPCSLQQDYSDPYYWGAFLVIGN